jgi:hypothetical protein
MQAFIKRSDVIDGSTALLGVSLTHGYNETLSEENINFAMQASVSNSLTPIPGSLFLIEKTPFASYVRVGMKVTTDVLPFKSGMSGFTSVSSNIFMDDSENIWSLRRNETGDILVRSNVIDDVDSINSLLESCSNVTNSTYNTRDKLFFQSLSNYENRVNLNDVTSHDYVTFVSDGHVYNGFIVLSHVDENSVPTNTFTALAFTDTPNQQPVTIPLSSILCNFKTPGYKQIEIMGVSESASANDIVSYYRKIYGHNAEFFKALETQINSYKFS